MYTNPNILKGNVSIPEEATEGGHTPLLHCHPDDYLEILAIIARYYKQGENNDNSEEANNENTRTKTKDHDLNECRRRVREASRNAEGPSEGPYYGF
jgi:hypothetical protein